MSGIKHMLGGVQAGGSADQVISSLFDLWLYSLTE